jgi:two-component system, NarL family, sensor histidine kinase NreB
MAATWQHREVHGVRSEISRDLQAWRPPAVSSGVDGVILLDREYKLLFASGTVSSLLGFAPDELVGRPLASLIHPSDRDDVLWRLEDVSKTPNASCTTTMRACTRAGVWRPIEIHAINVGTDDAPSLVATLREISEPRAGSAQATEALARTRVEDALGKLSLAIEQTADSVLITDHQGIIEYVNPAFEAMTGYTRDQAIGQTPRLLRSGVQTHEFYDRLWNTILSGRTFRSIMTNRRQDGTLYDEDQTITPIRNASGVITHFVSTGRDITQRKRTQEALRRLNQQLEVEAARIAGILHDEAGQFLTSAHITLAQVCEDVSPEIRERLITVRSHLDRIEERLRHISHEIHPRAVEDLGLRDAVEFMVEAFARRTGIDVTVNASIEARYPLPIETLLYRCVQEGLTNISRHARATSVVVRLSGDAAAVSCSVRDNGAGFDPTTLGSASRGSLGLRLMQDRLEAVGGTLEIISAAGKGTELRAFVPVST